MAWGGVQATARIGRGRRPPDGQPCPAATRIGACNKHGGGCGMRLGVLRSDNAFALLCAVERLCVVCTSRGGLAWGAQHARPHGGMLV
mmetsp:Transcript_18767/g.55920  ORF Transcript_18767/g.55920 Transcript_18767/m.55920 type:complete len:88 (-) Transcript_18767:265-528(-)|eukprot:306665-Chlamydomonas_euryale.AAC.4